MAQCGVEFNCLSLPSHPQDKAIRGQDGLLVLKSVKRTDSGMYNCKGVDYDNLDADLTGTVALTVNCERARRIRGKKKKIQAPLGEKKNPTPFFCSRGASSINHRANREWNELEWNSFRGPISNLILHSLSAL